MDIPRWIEQWVGVLLLQLHDAIYKDTNGRLRDLQGNYDMAFYLAGGLCFAAALLCANVRKAQVSPSLS
jgi:hypothetical protein